MTDPRPATRLDKWLWHARFFRTRGLASAQVVAGHVRVNGVRAVKPAQSVHPGDTLTFVQEDRIRLVRVLDFGFRRGPFSEAQALYLDLDAGPGAPAPGASNGAPSPLE